MTPPNEAYCREHAGKLDELHDDVREIASYVPKIEVALERLLSVQDTLKSFAAVHQELFSGQRKMIDDLTQIKVKIKELDGRLSVLEEARRGAFQVINPVLVLLIGGVLAALMTLAVQHGIGGR